MKNCIFITAEGLGFTKILIIYSFFDDKIYHIFSKNGQEYNNKEQHQLEHMFSNKKKQTKRLTYIYQIAMNIYSDLLRILPQ